MSLSLHFTLFCPYIIVEIEVNVSLEREMLQQVKNYQIVKLMRISLIALLLTFVLCCGEKVFSEANYTAAIPHVRKLKVPLLHREG